MADNTFDQQLQQKLDLHESQVEDHVWENIRKKKEDRRKGFLLFFRVMGAGILLASALLMPFRNNTSTNIQTKVAGSLTKVLEADAFTNKLQSAYNLKTDLVKQAIEIDPNFSGTHHPNYTYKPMVKSHSASVHGGKCATEVIVDSVVDILGADAKTGKTVPDETTIAPTPVKNSDSLSAKTVKTISVDSTGQKRNKSSRDTKLHHKRWLVDLYTSPDLPINSSSTSDIQEKMKLSFTFGLMVTKALGSRFSLGAGIQYSKINFRLQDSLSSAPQNLKSLDIPVLIGYRISQGHTEIMVHGGVIFNIHSTFTGDSFIDFFKSNTGISLYGGVNISEPVSDRLSIFAQPYYRYRITSMTKPSVDFNKHIDVTGLTIGLRYFFKKN